MIRKGWPWNVALASGVIFIAAAGWFVSFRTVPDTALRVLNRNLETAAFCLLGVAAVTFAAAVVYAISSELAARRSDRLDAADEVRSVAEEARRIEATDADVRTDGAQVKSATPGQMTGSAQGSASATGSLTGIGTMQGSARGSSKTTGTLTGSFSSHPERVRNVAAHLAALSGEAQSYSFEPASPLHRLLGSGGKPTEDRWRLIYRRANNLIRAALTPNLVEEWRQRQPRGIIGETSIYKRFGMLSHDISAIFALMGPLDVRPEWNGTWPGPDPAPHIDPYLNPRRREERPEPPNDPPGETSDHASPAGGEHLEDDI